MANINPLELVGQIPMHGMDHIQPLDDVSLWLQECGLGEYVQVFKTAGYDDINLIKILNEEDLDAMGIDKPGTRKKILMYADQLKQITETPLHSPIIEHQQRAPSQSPSKPKGNSRANPYRCTKCCEFKIRSLDGKAHQCKPELVGHSWENCPTQNIRQHPEERQRRKQDQKLNKGGRSRKRKGINKNDISSPESEDSPEISAWEYTGDHYQTQEGAGYAQDFADQHIFDFDGPPHKRIKLDISQQVADVSAHVMENYISDEIAKQLGGSDPRNLNIDIPQDNDDLQHIDFQ